MDKRLAKRMPKGFMYCEKKLKTESSSAVKSLSEESQLQINLDEDELRSCKKSLKEFLECTKQIQINVLEVQREVKIDARFVAETDEAILESFDQILKSLQEKMKKNWHKRMKGLFASLLVKYSKHSNIPIKNMEQFDWVSISKFFYNIQEQELREKLNSMLRHNPTKEIWDPTEDDLLVSIVTNSQVKNSWKSIARELFQRNPKKIFRSSKHCRERWLNHLNPDLNKDQWTLEEDIILLKSFLKYGRKWACIANELKGRTPCKTKNRFIHLQWVHDFSKTSQHHIPEKAISEIKVTIMKLESNFLRKSDTQSVQASSLKRSEVPREGNYHENPYDAEKNSQSSAELLESIAQISRLKQMANQASLNQDMNLIQRGVYHNKSQVANPVTLNALSQAFPSMNSLSNSYLQSLQMNIVMEMQRRRNMMDTINQNLMIIGQQNPALGLYLRNSQNPSIFGGVNSAFSISGNPITYRNPMQQYAGLQGDFSMHFGPKEGHPQTKLEEDDIAKWNLIRAKEEEITGPKLF